MTPDGATGGSGAGASLPHPWLAEASIWQLVESGGYRADLPLWAGLAATGDGPVLDLGCGIGRVTRHLAGRGRSVLGVEKDPGIAADFVRLADGSGAGIVVGDALLLSPEVRLRGPFGLIIAPQQLIQILGGAPARRTLLETVRHHLAPGGAAAFATVPDLPASSSTLDLAADTAELDGRVYSSLPLSIEATADRVEFTRLRERIGPGDDRFTQAVVTRFDRLPQDGLRQELRAAGLSPERVLPVPATAQHAPSVITVARREPTATR